MKSIGENELKTLQAQQDKKVLLADVRTPAEYNLQHIDGAINLPLDTFGDHIETLKQYDVVICYCNSGNSSSQFCKRAEQQGIKHILNMAGGLPACKTCTLITKKGPLPMMQQVQIAAGLLVLLGLILARGLHAYPRHEYFILLSAFVGGGLIFAGITGWCGMAKLLAKMPWNKIENEQEHTQVHGKDLIIKQFEDKNLAHYSYIAISKDEAIVVDPERDPKKYYEFAAKHNAKIIAVLNTHPHADFASGHLQIAQDTGAKIYVGSKVGAEYEHISLEGGELVKFGSSSFETYFTPGHSPDSISYLIKDAGEDQVGMFTGDRVFIGDVGRADLRETVGNIKAKQEELAGMMYDTTRTILPKLDGNLMLLAAHGAGTSCGKGLSKMNMDTLSNQIKYNPMLQEMTRDDFIKELSSEQPSIPAYFTNSVLLNKAGNISYSEAYKRIQEFDALPNEEAIVVDVRTREQAENNPMNEQFISIPFHNPSFVGMLGAMVGPDEKYVLVVEKMSDKDSLIHAILSIGYEHNCVGIYIIEKNGYHKHIVHKHDVKSLTDHIILDVRSESAFATNPLFTNTVNIPIEQLRMRIGELNKKAIYIPYCGGLYKSSIAFTVLQSHKYQVRKMYP